MFLGISHLILTIDKITSERINILKEIGYEIDFTNNNLQNNKEKLKEYRQSILDGLIEQELLIQESAKQGIVVKAEVIQEELDNFKKQFTSEEEFQKKLTEMNYSEDMIKTQIKRTKTIVIKTKPQSN